MATVGRRVRGVFLSRLASIQTQAKNLYKCKRDRATAHTTSAKETEVGAFELALRSRGRYSTSILRLWLRVPTLTSQRIGVELKNK